MESAQTTPALVLVHGYPFDHTMWDHVVALMSDDWTVIVPDLPGFGGRSVLDAEPGIGLMADDLLKILEERTLARVVLAGMSMGGYVALSFADHYPERLAGLCLVNSQPGADTEEVRAGRRAMIEKVRNEGWEAAAKAALPKLFAPANREKAELIRFPLLGAEKAGVGGITWALEAMAGRPDRTAVLSDLKAPRLIVHGSEDQFIPVAKARELASVIPGAVYCEIAGAGHCSPLEKPEAVAKALIDFLAGCSMRG